MTEFHGDPRARHLLDREPPEDYITEWQEELTRPKEQFQQQKQLVLMVFRLGNEWFALSIRSLEEVCEVSAIHSLPAHRGHLLLGLVNVRGRLRVCFSMHDLLQVEAEEHSSTRRRFVVIREKTDLFVFPVDEVHGIRNVDRKVVENVPVTVERSSVNFLKGMIPFKQWEMGLLDEELLFQSIRRGVKS